MTEPQKEEPPLVSWKDIAAYLKLSVPVAKRDFRKKGIQTFKLGRCVAIYPAELKEQLERTAQSLQQKLNKEMLIYFIQAEDRGIKIGITNNIEKRLKDLRANSPLELNLLGTMEGNLNTETKIHQRFKKYKIHGEWFEIDKSILDYIKRYKNG